MIKLFKRFGFIAILALLLTTLFAPQQAKACHLAAADISVTYVGPGIDGCTGTTVYEYEVEVVIYYACITCNGNGGATMTLRYASASAQAEGLPGATGDTTLTDPLAQAPIVHQLCAQYEDSNSCTVMPVTTNADKYPGFRIRRRVGTVILPYARKDWRFWHSESARSQSNINTAGCGSLYVEAMLDNVTKYNNSTLKFLTNPLPYICAGQPTTYLNGPYDPNGDSINVVLQPPHTNQTTQCNYNAPSTYANPIVSSTGFKLNSTTGTAEFTPSQAGKFVLAFRGEDYLRGTNTRLSYVYRDVQVVVLPCTDPPPAIDSIEEAITSIKNGTVIKSNTIGDAVFVCPGSDLSFDLNSQSKDATHNVYMYANTGLINGSSFTTNGQGTASVTGTFTWTPTVADIGEHTLIVESKDSTCLAQQPIVLTNYRVIAIKVLNGLDAGPDLPFCEVDPQPVQLFVRGSDDLRLKWTVDGGAATTLSDDTIHNPVASPTYTTNYVVTTPDLAGTCKAKDTVAVYIDESNKVEITPKNANNKEDALVMCRPGYLQLEALLSGRPPKNNVACGIGSPTLCNKQDTAKIYGSPLFGNVEFDSTGTVTPIMFNNLRTNKLQYLIRRDELQKSEIYSSTIRSIGFETKGTSSPNYEYANFRIFVKCTDKEELSSSEGFENFGMTQVYYSNSVTLPDGQHYFTLGSPYSWDTTKNLMIQICYSDNPTVETGCGVSSTPPIIPYVSTTYVSGLALRGADENVGSVCGVDKSSRIEAVLARPAFSFTYCEADPLDFVVTWNQGEYLSDTTILQPLAYVPKSAQFVVQTIGRSNCIMRDTLEVYVPDNDYKIEPADTALCLGDEAPFLIRGGFFFKWYEYRDGQYLPPAGVTEPTKGATFIGPDKTTDYRIVVSDSVWCYDTISARVEILPLPDVKVLNEDDTTVKYGQKFQLLASGAKYYNWSPVSSLNNPNISYPIARPTEDTKYIVGGIGSNGCRSFDTLHVIVDKSDNLFVPSAFSPNGDGKNDYFRVTNLSFQRIMEFRVFNRWGQEVFSTNDANRGWDGTFEGKPQDIGTYSYLIRVAYPDGFVETYRGETTLIR